MSMLPASTMKVTGLSQQNGRENVSREPTSRAATSISFLFFPVNDVDHEEQKCAQLSFGVVAGFSLLRLWKKTDLRKNMSQSIIRS